MKQKIYLLIPLLIVGLLFCANTGYSQSSTSVIVKGIVTDDDNNPLPGASVIIKGGPKKFTTTDIDGQYELVNVPTDAVLLFSYAGYEAQEVAVNGQRIINVQLKQESTLLQDVVVTGYQTLSKERTTGAFAKVSPETMETHRLSNLSTLMEGQVAGYSNGYIRGISTMNGNKVPLYVIDGFPVENTIISAYGAPTENLPDMNLEDIESITILKDAAAASIYGARAANGVIVITTKRAKQGKMQINFSSTFTWRPYEYYTDNITNSMARIDLEKQWATENPELNNGLTRAQAEATKRRNNYAWPSQGINVLLDQYTNVISETEANAKLAELAARGYAFYDDVSEYAKRDLFIQQYNLNVAKATDKNNFMISATYRKNREESAYTKNSQLGVNMNNSLQIAKWLTADVGVYFTYKDDVTPSYNFSSSYYSGFTSSPYDRLVDTNGNPLTMPSQVIKTVRDNIVNYGLYNVDVTPLNELGRRLTNTDAFSTRGFGKLEIKPVSWLSYNAMFQYEYGISRKIRQEELDSYATRTTINKFATQTGGVVTYNLPAGDIHYEQNNYSNAYNFRQQLNINKTFALDHEITAILGSETRNTKLEYRDQTLYGYDKDMMNYQFINQQLLTKGVPGLMNTTGYLYNSNLAMQSEMTNRFVSLYANAAYTYKQKYALTGSIRWDRSNLWGTNAKYQNRPLWSVGGSWNVNKENFFKVAWINMLKLRVSYGIGGNIAKDAAPYLVANYYASTFGGVYGNVPSPPNPNLRWEKTTTTDIGIDFALFRNRLSGSFDVYNKNSVDLLANQMGVPTEGFGYSTLKFNNGAMVNRGFELTLQGEVIQHKDFRWNAAFLMGYNKSEVTQTYMKAPAAFLQIDQAPSFPIEGNAYTAIYAFQWAGLDANGDPQIYDARGNKTTTNYQELEAIQYYGTTLPIYSGSFTNTLSYKNFDFSIMLLYAGGHKIKNTNIPAINMSMPTTTSNDVTERWRQVGDENKTDIPRVRFNGFPGYFSQRESLYLYSSAQILNATHFRINNVSLAYRLPAEWCHKLSLSGIRIQFNIENLAFFAADSKAKYSLGGYVKPNYIGGLYISF